MRTPPVPTVPARQPRKASSRLLSKTEAPATESQRPGFTHLVTTKILTNLVPGKSTVAFYGNADLDHAYLGRGVFQGYLPLTVSWSASATSAAM